MVTKLLTVQEAADAWRIKPGTVRAWVLRRKVNSFRVGRAVRISAEEIERILRHGLRPARGPVGGGK